MSFLKSKSALKSLTIQASTVSIAASLLPVLGINLAPDVMPHASAVLGGIASAVAIYGRIRAKTLIL